MMILPFSQKSLYLPGQVVTGWVLSDNFQPCMCQLGDILGRLSSFETTATQIIARHAIVKREVVALGIFVDATKNEVSIHV